MGDETSVMDNVKRAVKPRGHFIQNRSIEIAVGAILFMLGALLLYDAFDGRGRHLPWPLGAIAPWLCPRWKLLSSLGWAYQY